MKKFEDSFNGLKIALSHKAVIVQLVLGVMAIIGGLIIRLDYYEWLAFIICIGMVISLEIANSVIEKLCDLYSEVYDERIRKIKDMASAFVLVASICALIVCIIVVLRRIG